MHGRRTTRGALVSLALLAGVLISDSVAAGLSAGPPAGGGPVDHWTSSRVAAAVPRDLVVDQRGLGYLRGARGELTPHGHTVMPQHAPLRAKSQTPQAKPGGAGGGSGDTTPPVISAMDPASGATIGGSYAFSADVTDVGSGVRSVTFVITFPGGTQTQSFTASSGGDVWGVSLQGFTDGAWSWHVVARDNAPKGGNIRTSAEVPFTVVTSGGGGGGSGTATNAEWTAGGAVQPAAGRIYFEMPANRRQTRWTGYVCSGTVATDTTTGRSIIITAAHCVYDDVNKVFARNVLFIPNQTGTSGAGTDLNCDNDPFGCWVPSFGVVDADWASRTFPDNIPWDYAYYVVADTGSHQGTTTNAALDVSVGSLPVQFTTPTVGNTTHALGYSYSEDPKFMYCAEAMGTEGTANWWLPSCLLSGGSSGGPWVQPMNESTGSGPIISVNSWGYTGSPGMAGPQLAGSSASCLFGAAKTTSFPTVTNRGIIPQGC